MGKYWLIGLACVDCSDCAVAIGIQAMGIKDDARNFFGLIYFAISLSLNVFLTVMIVWRLLRRRIQIQSTLGQEHGKSYNFLATILAESALMNIMCTLGLLVTTAQGPLNYTSEDYVSSTSAIFYLFVAITPSIQVCPFFIMSLIFPS